MKHPGYRYGTISFNEIVDSGGVEGLTQGLLYPYLLHVAQSGWSGRSIDDQTVPQRQCYLK